MSRKHQTKSSLGYYYLMKILAGILLAGVIVAVVICAIHGMDYFSGGEEHLSVVQTVLMVASIPAVIYIGFYFSVVEAQDEGLSLRRNGKTTLKEWKNVKAIRQIPFCTPPVYRISFNDGESAAFVSVHSFSSISIGVWSWDFTDFKQQIRCRIE